MNKKATKVISTILLIVVVFQIFFPSLSFAENSVDVNSDTPLDAAKKNPSYTEPSVDPLDGQTPTPQREDRDGNPLTDGERDNDDINYDRRRMAENLTSGTAPRREGEESGVLKAGKYLITFVLNIFAKIIAWPLAAINTLLTLMYWEEPPKDIDSEQYKGIKTHLFTLENLFYNRVKILDANIFRKSEKPNGTNQSIKDNVATWTATIREISLVIILFIMLYLAIMLIVSTVQGKPAARANYQSFFIDIFISIFLAFMAPFFVAIVMYASDILTDLIREVAKALISQDNLNFEKVIIYSYADVKQFITNPTTNLINTVSYIILIILQIKFLWIFTRRFLSIAFLTMISPLISITYAVDKFKDGKTQVFTSWAAEVTRLAFLTPFYAAMYTIFAIAMGSLAEKAPLLGVGFLVFFGQIEKVLKETFGLSKLVGVKSVDDYSFDAQLLKDREEKKKKDKKKKEEEAEEEE